jgi:putative ABC transport system ATP-binding protein
LGVAGLLDERVATLSGGERQRVNILLAFAGNYPYVILDEPTAALSSEGKDQVNKSLSALSSDLGHTILVITHEATTATRTIQLRDGRIVADSKRTLTAAA